MSIAVSDVRNAVQDHPRSVGVPPESPRSIGVGDGVTTIFYLPVGKMQYYGSAALFDNAVGIPTSNYTISSTGVVTFTTAPTTGHILTAQFQTCIWTDSELTGVLTRNQAKYTDDQTV